MPVGFTAGLTEKSAALVLFVTWNVSVWPPSFGPAEIAVAHGLTVCAPAFSFTV